MSKHDYDSMQDEEIVAIAQSEGEGEALEYLLNKYKNFVRAKARSYFLIGADHEDIVQEGMIAATAPRPSTRSRSCALPARSSPRSKPRRGRSTFR